MTGAGGVAAPRLDALADLALDSVGVETLGRTDGAAIAVSGVDVGASCGESFGV